MGYSSRDFKESGGIEPSGFDFGVNFGLRVNIAKHRGVELYNRLGLLQQKDDVSISYYDGVSIATEKMIFKNQQPYAVGLRYVFSF